ncbi:MAG: hypothetical protein K2Q97_00135 [Burkholderiaceae bacterium]|nr:hypothetical protein [Burkholderiaceae bacterium]
MSLPIDPTRSARLPVAPFLVEAALQWQSTLLGLGKPKPVAAPAPLPTPADKPSVMHSRKAHAQ